MSPGKLAAQVAHASLAAVLKHGTFSAGDVTDQTSKKFSVHLQHIPALDAWLSGSFTKVVLGIDSEQELIDLHRKFEAISVLITDNGRTEFNGVATPTCLAIGPLVVDAFKDKTDHLSLY